MVTSQEAEQKMVEAQLAIVDRIRNLASDADADNLVLLAETFAWLVQPAQPHGEGRAVKN